MFQQRVMVEINDRLNYLFSATISEQMNPDRKRVAARIAVGSQGINCIEAVTQQYKVLSCQHLARMLADQPQQDIQSTFDSACNLIKGIAIKIKTESNLVCEIVIQQTNNKALGHSNKGDDMEGNAGVNEGADEGDSAVETGTGS